MANARNVTHTLALGLTLSLVGSTAVAQHRNLAVRTPQRVMFIRQAPQDVAPATTVTVNDRTLAQRAKWTQYLTARRAVMLDELQRFGEAGVFPLNFTTPGRANVMIDEAGNLCAVAHLMSTTGQDAMVRRASRANNAMLFANVPSGPIHNWVLRSGFTREEISRIQEPYEFQDRRANALSPGRVIERDRLMAHFEQLVPQLRESAAQSVAVAVERLGNAVMQDPPALPST